MLPNPNEKSMMRTWMTALLLLVPLFFPAVYPELAQGATCTPAPTTCPAGQTQYYEPSSDACPQGNFTCVASVRPSTPAPAPTPKPAPPPAPKATPTPPAPNDATIQSLLARVRELQAILATLIAAQGTS